MQITDDIRATAFSACWNQRAKLVKRLERQENRPTVNFKNTYETKQDIIGLDAAIRVLRL